MTLSVFCLTNDPGARVTAIMRQLRAVADEIVIAVDSRRDPQRLGRYAQAADRLLRYEFVDSSLQAVPWIVGQCSGDWLLQIDGDEVLSPALVERLPELIGASGVFQYRFPCRWLFPDATHYLAQPPWHFSGLRLVRNDPATLWHGGVSHTPFDPVFPSVDLDEGFYHLSLLVNDLAYREAKVAHYLSIKSSHSRRVLEDDVTAFYLPERDRRFGASPVPVPSRDHTAIAEVLGASGDELRNPPTVEDIHLAGWGEIQLAWPRRTLSEQAYQGKIEAFESAPGFHCGQQRPLTVRVGNGGDEHWPGLNREPSIQLSHRWLTADDPASEAWTNTCLPASLSANAAALVPVPVEAPQSPGRHTLELTLVHTDPRSGHVIRRFASVSLPIEVKPR
jgi:hypothetical protein